MIRDLIISDLHVGSFYGLMPPEIAFIDTFSGQEIEVKANKNQKQMWKYFNECMNAIGSVDTLVINGDICDGPQIASRGKYTWTNDLNIQAKVAAEIINTIDAKKIYCIKGTDYHCQTDRPLEELVAQLVDGIYREETIIKHGKCRYHVMHHVSITSSAYYRSTAIAKQMLFASLNEKEEEYGKLNAVVRSHAHYWCGVALGHAWGFITPGWCLSTPFKVKIGLLGAPDVGYLVLDIDEKTGKMSIQEDHRHFGPQCPIDEPERD